MAYKEEWPDRWGWGHGGGESERGAVGGAEGVASYGVTNPGRKSLSCGELAAENRRLYLDNMRLWDCLALFRTDPCLTCQGAINTIFTLDDNEYLREFPGESLGETVLQMMLSMTRLFVLSTFASPSVRYLDSVLFALCWSYGYSTDEYHCSIVVSPSLILSTYTLPWLCKLLLPKI